MNVTRMLTACTAELQQQLRAKEKLKEKNMVVLLVQITLFLLVFVFLPSPLLLPRVVIHLRSSFFAFSR